MILMTASGRTVDIAWHGRSDFDRVLYIGTNGISMAEATTIFGDPAEVKTFDVFPDEQNMEDDGLKITYKGFTELVSIRNDRVNGTINVGLARQEVEE